MKSVDQRCTCTAAHGRSENARLQGRQVPERGANDAEAWSNRRNVLQPTNHRSLTSPVSSSRVIVTPLRKGQQAQTRKSELWPNIVFKLFFSSVLRSAVQRNFNRGAHEDTLLARRAAVDPDETLLSSS